MNLNYTLINGKVLSTNNESNSNEAFEVFRKLSYDSEMIKSHFDVTNDLILAIFTSFISESAPNSTAQNIYIGVQDNYTHYLLSYYNNKEDHIKVHLWVYGNQCDLGEHNTPLTIKYTGKMIDGEFESAEAWLNPNNWQVTELKLLDEQ